MNRKQRRAAAKMGEQKTMTTDELSKMRSMCAWDGCQATAPSAPLDPGWRCLIVYQQDGSGDLMGQLGTGRMIDRDAVLCPEHAAGLDDMLKPLARIGDPQGTA